MEPETPLRLAWKEANIVKYVCRHEKSGKGKNDLLKAKWYLERLLYTEYPGSGQGVEIVTLCGSTKFREEYIEVNRIFTLQGKIVLAPAHFHHGGDGPLSDEQKAMLDDLHFRKIELSDSIFVIDVDGYIGESTKREIEYAEKLGREVEYLSDKKML